MKDEKIIVFLTDIGGNGGLDEEEILVTWEETETAIKDRVRHIVTTQMGLLSTDLFGYGYHVFVSDRDGLYEIVLGSGNMRTGREIRMSHDLFRLWVNGEFDI